MRAEAGPGLRRAPPPARPRRRAGARRGLAPRLRQKRAAPWGGSRKDRRRPTLPGGCPPSTIGAERLNGSVRNGKRCFPLAISPPKHCETAPVELENRTRLARSKEIRQALDPLVPVC